jgi:hypothetical protein
MWSIFNFLCSSNSYLATTYTCICSLHAYGIDVNFAYIFVAVPWSLLPTFLLPSFPLWHVFIWYWLGLRGLRNHRLCLFISLISPPVLRIFWPNSIFLRNYIIPGWNLRIFCKFLKLLPSLVLQFILKVQRVLCFSDGTKSIFWDISIGGKSTSSSCLLPLLLFHCW